MKLVLIVYSAALEAQVLEALERIGANTYTKLPRIHGVGTHSPPHLDTHVWPGTNNGLLIATDEESKDRILKEIGGLKAAHQREGIKAFVMPVEEIL